MPKKSASSRDLATKVDEIKQKLILLDGDRKSHSETAENVLKVNREKILNLTEENKILRKKLSTKNKSNEAEKQIIFGEDTNGDLKNKLNLLRYETKKKEKILKENQKQSIYGQNKENSDVKDKQAARDLENRLDKTNLKQKEAEHIQRTYQQIKSKLEDEHKTYESQLDEIQQEINRMRNQMKELEVMNAEAVASRDLARAELERREKEVYAERKRMELEMQRVKKEAEEKRLLHIQLDAKRQEARHSIMEELTEEERQRLREEEEEERMRNYENFFRVIKDATGVSDTQEVVIRFEMQGETRDQLNELKQTNEERIIQLTETKEMLALKYEQLIYSSDNSTEKKEELLLQNSQMEKENERKQKVEKELKNLTKILIDAKSGIDHLYDKLQPVKLDDIDDRKKSTRKEIDLEDENHEDAVTQVAEDTQVSQLVEPAKDYDLAEVDKDQGKPLVGDEITIQKLEMCEKKLNKLAYNVEKEIVEEGKDIQKVCKELEDLEYQLASEIQLPIHNTRIQMADSSNNLMFAEDDQSGEDDEVLTREKLKKQSQQIVEAKNKRVIGKRKKKTK